MQSWCFKWFIVALVLPAMEKKNEVLGNFSRNPALLLLHEQHEENIEPDVIPAVLYMECTALALLVLLMLSIIVL